MAGLFVRALRAHQWLYEKSGGLVGHRLLFGNPTLLLRTAGRKTGAARTSALTYARDGEDYLVTASNGGSPRPPGWLANLKARPDCEIQVGRRALPVRARTTLPDDPEYARRWGLVDAVNQGRYSEYQKKTKRPIAVVVLSPKKSAGQSE
ncbi:nitroreductase family deazaflavin-dependent oxidoreductase [Nocardia sp. NBC_01329]|uniref:nitroreductase family deazaflavin-dependent oxidoreductase n=1 Tax=Nocardia sp. NBC_01329 TaxID=2903594 RepID=UPI002E0ED398|nr:nitroreductase family deazaflavin-dependent oxidoreductase [Nocardia sp. NBC_01329]